MTAIQGRSSKGPSDSTHEAFDSREELEAACALAESFLGSAFAGLTLMTLRERGEAATLELWRVQQGHHQAHYYLQGLKKLGIDKEPPAVAAAKYHYFSNSLGGLKLEYVEESNKKVWIRYPGPIWTYPGISMLAMSGEFRRNVFASWHRRNGAMMGCPRLGWVSTKFIMDGDPYDEGYFIEYDHDVDPNAPLRVETVSHTPEFDPSRAPILDPEAWPEERKLKARRNYSRGYLHSAISAHTRMYGEETAVWLLRQTMRCLAVQRTYDFEDQLWSGNGGAPDQSQSAIERVIALTTGLLRACGQQYIIDRSGAEYSLQVASLRGLEDASDPIREAIFSFYETAGRMISGRIKITRDRTRTTSDPDVWHFQDTGKWLW